MDLNQCSKEELIKTLEDWQRDRTARTAEVDRLTARLARLEKVVEAVRLFKDHADNPKSWDNDSWDRVEAALAAVEASREPT